MTNKKISTGKVAVVVEVVEIKPSIKLAHGSVKPEISAPPPTGTPVRTEKVDRRARRVS